MQSCSSEDACDVPKCNHLLERNEDNQAHQSDTINDYISENTLSNNHVQCISRHAQQYQSVNVPSQVPEDHAKTSNPIKISVMDGQVFHLMSKPFVNDYEKSGHDYAGLPHIENSDKSLQKSFTLLNTPTDKSCIVSQEISIEEDYILPDGVLCEDILHSSRTLPVERILTIPSPSLTGFSTGSKPDPLAIAASEVFRDNRISSHLQGIRYVEDPTENQLGREDNYELQGHVPFSDCIQDDKSNSYVIRSNSNKFEIDCQASLVENKLKLVGDCRISSYEENIVKSNTTINAFDDYDRAKASSTTDSFALSRICSNDYNTNNPALPDGEVEELPGSTKTCDENSRCVTEKSLHHSLPQPILYSSSCQITDGIEKHQSEGIATGNSVPPRRSSRVLKVKKDLDFVDTTTCSERLRTIKKRYSIREWKRPLWDCNKCDAMFKTKASRNRHMQEGHEYTCSMCNWRGLCKTDYEVHISTVHCSQKAKCSSCSHSLVKRGEDLREIDKIELAYLEEKEEDIDDPDYNPHESTDDGTLSSLSLEKEHCNGNKVEDLQDVSNKVCPYCGKKFERKCRFIRHLNYHLGNKNFKCKYCEKAFVEKSGLDAHLITHSPINKPCPKCKRICKNLRTFKRHLRTHAGILYTCDVCLKTFRHEGSLRFHKKSHKEGGTGNVCRYCEKDCKTPYYLQLHMRNKHEKPKFLCNICNQTFKWKQSHRIHMLSHDKNSGLSVKSKRPKESTTGQRKKCVCDVCGKEFKNYYTRLKHTKIVHQEGQTHICPQCGSLFKAKVYLDQHIALVHTTKARVKCQTCGHDFKNMMNLKSHIKLVHKPTTEKYSCSECKKTFNSPKDLNRHKKVHTGEKNHVCPVCRRSFSRKDNMTAHLRTHSSKDSLHSLNPVCNLKENTDTKTISSTNQQQLQILEFSSNVPSSNSNSVCINNQESISTSSPLMDSVNNLVSGNITFSALPLPPSPLPNSISNTVVYSNCPSSSTCIVLTSKPSTSPLPVVVLSDSSVSNNHLIPYPPASNSISMNSLDSNIGDFTINSNPVSMSSLPSVTTLTYCNNVTLVPSSSNNLYGHTAYPHESPSSHHNHLSAINSVNNDNADHSCLKSLHQESTTMLPQALHTDQIVLATEEVLNSSPNLSS